VVSQPTDGEKMFSVRSLDIKTEGELTLTRFQAGVLFANNINATTTAHDLAIAAAGLGRFQ
jgi:hypothetical protein